MPSTEFCPDEPDRDWGIEELKAMLRKVVTLDGVSAKFCFFIDGLDEYHGDEENLADIISFCSGTLGIKLCVSSRPRLVLDEAFEDRRENLVISDFIKDDMITYVRTKLELNQKFQKLQVSYPSACGEIVAEIAEASKGVWLWVYLVTHDLVKAVNRNEGITTLRKILGQFPRELKDYFTFIIEGVEQSLQEEMAQIFLITIVELQPLPLAVFSLLEVEKQNPEYAIKAPLSPLDTGKIAIDSNVKKSRLQNRCKDLLVVEDGLHPTFLNHPVDFLHRTVRDFLRECYYDRLTVLAPGFDPLLSLCRMMLFLLKGLPPINLRVPASITRLILIVDELLYYAHESEKQSCFQALALHEILEEVDRVSTELTGGSVGNHWTHIRDLPGARGLDEYREGQHCNFLALAVQARLTKYVKAKLDGEPGLLNKRGRPLLDYALRPRRVTPISMPYHSQRAEASVDTDMVRLLLKKGANPNQQVHLNDGKTVWALFLLSCYESTRRQAISPVLKSAWYRASELMIRHGAQPQIWLSDDTSFTFEKVLGVVFGQEKAEHLQRLMVDTKLQRQNDSWFPRWLSGLL
jgi:hypothetical protein